MPKGRCKNCGKTIVWVFITGRWAAYDGRYSLDRISMKKHACSWDASKLVIDILRHLADALPAPRFET